MKRTIQRLFVAYDAWTSFYQRAQRWLIVPLALFASLTSNAILAQQTVFISDFHPRQVRVGDIVTVIGTGFLSSPTPPTHADVGGAPFTPVRVLSDTELEFEVKPQFITQRIWLRNVSAQQLVMNVANSADRLTILGTPSGPPAAPDQVAISVVSGSALEVRWRDNAVDESYQEVSIDFGAFGWTTYRLGSDVRRLTIDNLQSGRAYTVQVLAGNAQGRSSSALVTGPVLPKVAPLVGTITISNTTFISTLEPGTYHLKEYQIDALNDLNATGVVELGRDGLQTMPNPNTLLFPMQSIATPTNPPWTSYGGQKYQAGSQFLIGGYISTSVLNRRPQFVALHIRKNAQGAFEATRMLGGDLWDCILPTQSGCELKGEVMENVGPIRVDFRVPEPGRLAGTATATVEFRLDRIVRSADISFTFNVFFRGDAP